MSSSEELRETLVALRCDNERLRTETAHASLLLQALDSLLQVELGDDPFARVFHSLSMVFDFVQAIVLEEGDGEQLGCIAAAPSELVGTRYRANDFLERVMAGRVCATFCNRGLEPWRGEAPNVVSPNQPALYFPIHVRGRRGVLMMLRPEGAAAFDRDHVTLARKFSLLASHALAARKANQTEAEGLRLRQLTSQLQLSEQEAQRNAKELAHRAYFDDLTGLPNRALMQQRVEAQLHDHPQERFALAFIDLDRFKQVNDYYSHAIGDALLISVARRFVGRKRESDTLARISGDEFVLLISPLGGEEDLHATIDGVLAELQQPFHIEGFDIFSSASIGVSIYPDHGADYEALRRNADSAMYYAKANHKGQVAFFDPSLGRTMVARMDMEQRLRVAIRDCKFRCAFQPKVDIRSGRIVGFEALVRWLDQDGVIHAPGSFIELAVELGLIDQITHFILAEANEALARLDAHFGSGTTVSINIAAKRAVDPRFMKSFADALRASGRADRFMLELTEEALIATDQFQSEILPGLRAIGVGVSIDDFGTGYSSLSTLADITADELKVDRSFITAIHKRQRSQVVLKAIESLGQTLRIPIVAEGVETLEELTYLTTATHIQFAQGYYFARPMFVEDLICALAPSAAAVAQPRLVHPRVA
jgi:diguanylate cyclase (GGDEF)-like protein